MDTVGGTSKSTGEAQTTGSALDAEGASSLTRLSRSTPEQVREYLAEVNPDAFLFDGFDEALVGVCEAFGQEPRAMYDYDWIIKILVERDGVSYDDAVEYYGYNMIGAWLGDSMPVVARFHTEL